MKNLTLNLRKLCSAIRLFVIKSLLGEVSFDEQMDCYWEGHHAAMENRVDGNPYFHPLRRKAFAAGVLMEEAAVTVENPDFPAYGKEWHNELNQGVQASNDTAPQLASA